MKEKIHKIKHTYQPTNMSCSQACMSILLSFFDIESTPREVMKESPVTLNAKGEEDGTISQEIATWAISQDFDVDFYTFDCQVIDLSWCNYDNDKLIKRMKLAQKKRNVPRLGKKWSARYVELYIKFIEAGGKLHIRPSLSTQLLYELADNGPFYISVGYRTLHGLGASDNTGLRKSKPNDAGIGKAGTHAVVVYGYDKNDNFLVADPWLEPGTFKINKERLLYANAVAQMTSDNALFQIRRRV